MLEKLTKSIYKIENVAIYNNLSDKQYKLTITIHEFKL